MYHKCIRVSQNFPRGGVEDYLGPSDLTASSQPSAHRGCSAISMSGGMGTHSQFRDAFGRVVRSHALGLRANIHSLRISASEIYSNTSIL
mgnify:CR=1 FL=1